MNKVNITNASLTLIVRSLGQIKTKISREVMAEEIISDFTHNNDFTSKDLDEFYNTPELKDMYNMKMVLKNFEELIATIDNDRKVVSNYILNQNKRYAQNVKAPAYHYDYSCELMKSNFTNIKLPDNFTSDNNRAKKWIVEHRGLPFYELNKQFMVQFKTLDSLVEIDFKNSGKIEVENSEVKLKFAQELKEYKGQMILFLNGELAKKIENYKYAPKYKIDNIVKYEDDVKVQESIVDFHTAKQSMHQIIYEKFYKKYNINLSFDKHILDLIGFRECNGCKKNLGKTMLNVA